MIATLVFFYELQAVVEQFIATAEDYLPDGNPDPNYSPEGALLARAQAIIARITAYKAVPLPPPNIDRASSALDALTAFRAATGVIDEEEAITDLVANLGHYCDEQNFAFEPILQSAIGHWRTEQEAQSTPTPQVPEVPS